MGRKIPEKCICFLAFVLQSHQRIIVPKPLVKWTFKRRIIPVGIYALFFGIVNPLVEKLAPDGCQVSKSKFYCPRCIGLSMGFDGRHYQRV